MIRERFLGGLVYFIPAALFASFWFIRNLVMTGHLTYPYGIYFPSSGSYGRTDNFFSYLIAHAELAKPFGDAFTVSTVGPFIALGVVMSMSWWMRRNQSYARLFFQSVALVTVIGIVGTYFVSNINPRYYMYWLAILALCSIVPVDIMWRHIRFHRVFFIPAIFTILTISVVAIGYYNLRPALNQVATASVMGDFRKITPQPSAIINYANKLHRKNPDALWATPLILGADYYLETSNLVSYGWPPFPTSLKLLRAQTPEDSYDALKAEGIRYLMYFRVMPQRMYINYRWNEEEGRVEHAPGGNDTARKSNLRQTLALLDIDEKGKLIKYNERYLILHFVSEPSCAYWIKTGCLLGKFNQEKHYLFEIRKTPIFNKGWVDVEAIPPTSK